MNPVILFLKDVASETIATIIIAGLVYLVVKYRSRLGRVGKNMSVSPDGSKIISEVDGDLYITSPTGTTNLTHSPNAERGAIWANSSEWVAFRKKVGDQWQVWVGNTESGKMMGLAWFFENERERPIEWDTNDNLIIDWGGSKWVIKNDEIARRLQ